MNGEQPTLEEWRELYAAADAFHAAAPWQWMYDSDVFAVENPETGEVGYCSVMGNAGEHFALGVYEGAAGLASLLEIQVMGELAVGSFELAVGQSCLMGSFEDRDQLNPPDIKIIKELGLKYRGRNAWPQFRRVRPYRVPWYLRDVDARYLATAFRQALDVALRYKDDESLLGEEEDDDSYLVRVCRQTEAGLEWSDERQPAPDYEATPVEPYVPDDLEATRLRRLPHQPGRELQADFELLPSGITSDEGPYFPYILLVVDPGSGLILGTHMSDPWNYAKPFGQTVVKALEALGARPGKIVVGREELYELLRDIAARFKIELEFNPSQPELEMLFDELLGQFER